MNPAPSNSSLYSPPSLQSLPFAQTGDGARALSEAELSQRALLNAAAARQRGPLTVEEQRALQNYWGGTADASNRFVPNPPKPTFWARLKSVFHNL